MGHAAVRLPAVPLYRAMMHTSQLRLSKWVVGLAVLFLRLLLGS